MDFSRLLDCARCCFRDTWLQRAAATIEQAGKAGVEIVLTEIMR